MPDIPHQFAKTRRGQIRVKYNCPECDSKLESELAEAGSQDVCPDCSARFVVPGVAKRKSVEAELKKRAAQRIETEKALRLEAKAEADVAARQKKEAEAEERRKKEERRKVEADLVEQATAPSTVAPLAAASATPAPPPWAPPQPSFQDSPTFASNLPTAGNTAYPALELYANILRVLGWIMVILGGLSALLLVVAGLFPAVTSGVSWAEAIGGGIAAVITAAIVLVVYLLWALAFFVAAEFIKLALDARRDIATNVELTRSHFINSNR